MWDRSRLFLRRAGTVILGINILLWALATYPKSDTIAAEFAAKRQALEKSFAPGLPTGVSNDTARTEQLAALDAGGNRRKIAAQFCRLSRARD